MKIELLIICATIFLIYNTYHDGKYTKMVLDYKKYYMIAFYGLLGLSIVVLMKKNPHNTHDLLYSATNLMKVCPMDKNASKIINPILNFSKTQIPYNYNRPTQVDHGPSIKNYNPSLIPTSIKHKRSVTESKKKYVAANQNWKCGHCKNQLSASYEVDHINALYKGGDNSVSNLLALCRNCHGIKTMKDNLDI
jgi:5-methylcytosine-specific restriction endonuclease McrA